MGVKLFMDDFICDITCEEYYGDEDDLYWGDQEEQAHAGEIISMGSAISTTEYLARDYKLFDFFPPEAKEGETSYTMTMKIDKCNWQIVAHHVKAVYGVYVDWKERFFICPNCEEPVYECDWTDEDFSAHMCPICEFNGEEDE